MSYVESIRWKGREAIRLTNDVVELIALTEGGHLVSFRFADQAKMPSQNVFWEAPWETVDPTNDRFKKLSTEYGSPQIGRFLAGFSGHALCLDYFGPPSIREADAGLSIHGEAARTRWNAVVAKDTKEATCQWNVELPVARLQFNRKVHLGVGESVAFIEECVSNQREMEHSFHWVQHATFGPPFLSASKSAFVVSAVQGVTSPETYEECSFVMTERPFLWPYLPCKGANAVDLRSPFSTKGTGFLAAVKLDPQRDVEYMLAINWELRLVVGYCFRRADFPWITIWEENCVHQSSPWNAMSEVRGMEFGTTPLALGRDMTLERGPLLETPVWCTLPSHGKRKVRYLGFIFGVPPTVSSIETAGISKDTIDFYGEHAQAKFSIPAIGCENYLSGLGE